MGIGSGLVFHGPLSEDLLLTILTNRGPNTDRCLASEQEAKSFACPQFTPLLMKILIGDTYDGGYWLCGKYGPCLTHDDSQSKILAKHGPTALPGERAVIAPRRPALPVQSRNWR